MIITENKSNQEIVNEILELLIVQGDRCGQKDKEGVFICNYGDGKGRHCAIGHLLPDNREELMTHGGGAASLVELYHLGPNHTWIQDNLILVCKLQELHDARGTRTLKRIKEHIALHFDLNMDLWDEWIDMISNHN